MGGSYDGETGKSWRVISGSAGPSATPYRRRVQAARRRAGRRRPAPRSSIARKFGAGHYDRRIGASPVQSRPRRWRDGGANGRGKADTFHRRGGARRGVVSGAAAALIRPEIGAISCRELFLGDIDTNPADYLLFRAFIQGYLAATAGADDRRNDAAAMSSVVSYCKGQAEGGIRLSDRLRPEEE